MIIREILPEDRKTYNDCVSHILQSFEWGIFREAMGVKIARYGMFEGALLNLGYQFTIHSIPYTSYTVGYFPRGKITKDIIDHLCKLGGENNLLFIKMEPMIVPEENFIPSVPILPRHTFMVDLTGTEEEILGRMKEKTRYNIKVAQKHGVAVEEKSDNQSLEIFINLVMETAKRQGFFSHPALYYRKLWEILKPQGMAHLIIARYQTTPLAALMLFKFKDQFYYPYGGSATTYRDKMPNYLLHFEAIKLGKLLGCKTYDMWGAYKESPTEKDPWFGIYRFKEGFGGKLVSYPQTVDLVFQPRLYKIYNILDPLRFKLLAIKRHLPLS